MLLASGVVGTLQVDLNRDFPDPFERGQAGIVQPSGTEQPETLVLMRWIREGRFVVSASMHEAGTLFHYLSFFTDHAAEMLTQQCMLLDFAEAQCEMAACYRALSSSDML